MSLFALFTSSSSKLNETLRQKMNLNNKKVLIITYYWPPSGGAGVQRWLKFVKYLPKNGWDPIVYTTENGEYPVLDHQLAKEIPENVQVIKTPIWEPYSWYKKLSGRKKK